MGRYNLNDDYDDGMPWWGKVIGVVLLCGAVALLLAVMKWWEHH
ncbi:hypothetical protein [Hymenobacter rubidus]|nr:hypothetical protein [Hymenobacter rubidus]